MIKILNFCFNNLANVSNFSKNPKIHLNYI
jgi:hypothetical protein